MAVKDSGNSWSGSVRSTVGLNSSNSSIPGRVVSTKTISGTVGKIVEPVYYIGLTTDTAATETDKRNRTIKVDVLKTPETLTIINKEDNPNGETVDFNGSVAKQLVLRNYTIGKIADNEFALLKDGIKTGESIIIPDGEKIDTVTLVFVSDVPYLKFTFSNSDREPLFCSLEDLGIAEIKEDIAKIKADLILLNASIEAVSTSLDNHIADKNNPHEVTKSQVGLGNVVNTGDSATPVEDGVTKFTTGGAYTLKTTLEGAIQSEAQVRSDEDGRLAGLINTLDGRVINIEELIPEQASANNKLADKEFVNSSIATNTANFLGTYNVVTDLGLTRSATHAQVANALELKMIELGVTPTNNDYCFIIIPDAEIVTQVEQFDRYKYTVTQESGLVDEWRYEYTLNNSSFTSAQWAAINSGITSAKVSSYDAHILDKNNPHEVTKAQVGLGNVDNTSDLNKPVSTATRALVEEHDIHFIGEFESYDDLEAESATINDFATITIQSGNDLDYEIWLYTAEGWEYTYGFTIAGIYAIADFDVLPEVTQYNKDIFARIDGKDIYSAEYKEAVPTVISMPPVVSASSSSPIDNISSYFTDYDNLTISNENIDNCYVNRYNIPDNPFQAIRLGTKNNVGECTFQLNSFPAIEETDTVYLELSNYFSYVQNTGAITGATETTAYIQIDSGSILYVDDLELNYIDATTQPPLTDIDITAQVKNLLDDDEEISINIGKTDGANRFFFCGFKIVGEDGTVKRWLKIAHTDYVDEKIDEVNTAISDLDNRLSQDEEDITTLQSDLEDTNEEVHWIKTEMGTVQIFDRDELPAANDSYLNKILRVDHKLYQCIKTGDENAFVKHYSFEDMTGSSEIFKYNWADAARIVTNDFDDYFTATWEDNEPMSSYDVQVGEIYKYSLNNTENAGILFSDKGNITLLSGLDNFIFTRDDTSVPYPLYNIDYVESSIGQGDLVSVTITISGTAEEYDWLEAVDVLQYDGHLEHDDASDYIQQVIDGETVTITWTEDLDNIDFDYIVNHLNSDGFISSLNRQYPTTQYIFVDDVDNNEYNYTNNYDSAGNFWITYLVNEVSDWGEEDNLNVYHIKYPWDSNKIFRESGALKFGNSSGDTGNVKLYRIDESELPITRVDLDVKAWSATKDSCIILGIYDKEQGSNAFDAEILPASEDLYHLVYDFKNNTEAIEPLINDGKSWINISTEKGQKISHRNKLVDTIEVTGHSSKDGKVSHFDYIMYRNPIFDEWIANAFNVPVGSYNAYVLYQNSGLTNLNQIYSTPYILICGLQAQDPDDILICRYNGTEKEDITYDEIASSYIGKQEVYTTSITLSDNSVWYPYDMDSELNQFWNDKSGTKRIVSIPVENFEVGYIIPLVYVDDDYEESLNLPVISLDYQQEEVINYTDTRAHLLAIDVYYGITEYNWVEVSGGANVEIVEELPEVGEENTIYLIEDTDPEPSSSIKFEEVDTLPAVGDPSVVYLMDPEGEGGGGDAPSDYIKSMRVDDNTLYYISVVNNEEQQEASFTPESSSEDSPKIYTVDDIRDVSSDTINNLKQGDILIYDNMSYICSYRDSTQVRLTVTQDNNTNGCYIIIFYYNRDTVSDPWEFKEEITWPLGEPSSNVPTIYTVNDIEAIPSNILNQLRAGDIVKAGNSSSLTSYTCVNRYDGSSSGTLQLVCNTNASQLIVEYNYSNNTWSLDSSYEYEFIGPTKYYQYTLTIADTSGHSVHFDTLISRSQASRDGINSSYKLLQWLKNYTILTKNLMMINGTYTTSTTIMPCKIDLYYNSSHNSYSIRVYGSDNEIAFTIDLSQINSANFVQYDIYLNTVTTVYEF